MALPTFNKDMLAQVDQGDISSNRGSTVQVYIALALLRPPLPSSDRLRSTPIDSDRLRLTPIAYVLYIMHKVDRLYAL